MGRFSLSNLIQQSVICIDGLMEGGKMKMKAAAEAPEAIVSPDIRSEGIVLAKSMLSHAFGGMSWKG